MDSQLTCIIVHERLGDFFGGKYTYVGKKKGENVTFDVKFRNFESCLKKDWPNHILEKVTWKSITCEIFLDSLNNFLKLGVKMLHCLRGMDAPEYCYQLTLILKQFFLTCVPRLTRVQ